MDYEDFHYTLLDKKSKEAYIYLCFTGRFDKLIMPNFNDTIVDKYLKGTLDVTALTPKDFLFLQTHLLKRKRFQDVQKLASIARNRTPFTGKLDIETTEKPPAVSCKGLWSNNGLGYRSD